MCRRHHRLSQDREEAFQQEHKIDMLALALEYAVASRDKLARVTGQAITALFQGKPVEGAKLQEMSKEIEEIIKRVKERAAA
jgi:hypothetical protein